MKKVLGFLLVCLALASTAAQAQHRGYRYDYNRGHGPGFNGSNHYHHYRGNDRWIAPAIIGGLLVYGITRQQEQQPPIYVAPPPVAPSVIRESCPENTVATYRRSLTRDAYGRQVETFSFMGCAPIAE